MKLNSIQKSYIVKGLNFVAVLQAIGTMAAFAVGMRYADVTAVTIALISLFLTAAERIAAIYLRYRWSLL